MNVWNAPQDAVKFNLISSNTNNNNYHPSFSKQLEGPFISVIKNLKKILIYEDFTQIIEISLNILALYRRRGKHHKRAKKKLLWETLKMFIIYTATNNRLYLLCRYAYSLNTFPLILKYFSRLFHLTMTGRTWEIREILYAWQIRGF